MRNCRLRDDDLREDYAEAFDYDETDRKYEEYEEYEDYQLIPFSGDSYNKRPPACIAGVFTIMRICIFGELELFTVICV